MFYFFIKFLTQKGGRDSYIIDLKAKKEKYKLDIYGIESKNNTLNIVL